MNHPLTRHPHVILEDLEEEEDEDSSIDTTPGGSPQLEPLLTNGTTVSQCSSPSTPKEAPLPTKEPSSTRLNGSSSSRIGSRHEFAHPRIDEQSMQNMMNLKPLNEGQSRFGESWKYLNRSTMAEYCVKKWEWKGKDNEALFLVCSQLDHFSMLRHPRLASFYGYHLSDNTITMFRTFVPPGTVADKLKRGPLAEQLAMKFFKQMIEGLQYLHERSIVHGNIKSSNVLITISNDIKLADMAISNSPNPDVHRKRTLLHSAPELFKDRNSLHKTTPATDIWAAGCVLVAMATRFPPFKDHFITLSVDKLYERLMSAHDSSSAKALSYRSETLIPTASREMSDLVDTTFVPSQSVRSTATQILETFFSVRSPSNTVSAQPSIDSIHFPKKVEEMNIDDLYNDAPQTTNNQGEKENEEDSFSDESVSDDSADSEPSAVDCLRWLTSRFLIFASLLLKWVGMVILTALSLGMVAGSVFFAIFVIYNGIGVVCQCQLNEGFIVLIALILLPVIILLTTLCCNNSCEQYKQAVEEGKVENCRYVYPQPEEDIILCGIIVVDGKKEQRKPSVRRKNASPEDNEATSANNLPRAAFIRGVVKIA